MKHSASNSVLSPMNIIDVMYFICSTKKEFLCDD